MRIKHKTQKVKVIQMNQMKSRLKQILSNRIKSRQTKTLKNSPYKHLQKLSKRLIKNISNRMNKIQILKTQKNLHQKRIKSKRKNQSYLIKLHSLIKTLISNIKGVL